MASFNVTGELFSVLIWPLFESLVIVEDSSPLITYAPAGSWTDTPSNDPLATVSINLASQKKHTH